MARHPRTPPMVFAGQLGLLSFGLLAGGPFLVRLGAIPPDLALSMSAASGVTSALASGIIAYGLAKGLRPTTTLGWIGMALAIACTTVTIAWTYTASRYPKAYDFATDVVDPPTFADGESGKPTGLEGLDPRTVDDRPARVRERVERTFRALPRWRVVHASDTHLEGIAVSPLFRFEDDIAIDLRVTTSSQTVVQVRARARVPQPDMGRNVEHIRTFLEALDATP